MSGAFQLPESPMTSKLSSTTCWSITFHNLKRTPLWLNCHA